MKANTIDWEKVGKWTERSGLSAYWKVYGAPTIISGEKSALSGAENMPRWDVDERVLISAAINGAFFTKKENPNQAVTPEEIIRSAEECIAEGAQVVHVHVRDPKGYNVLDVGLFTEVLTELQGRHPKVMFDACLVAVDEEECVGLDAMLTAGLMQAVPVNTTAIILGDNLLVKPPHVIIEKTKRALDAGLMPQISVYNDADIDNARRFLIDSGLVKPPFMWLVLSGLPGCSPMYSPETMVDGIMRMVRLIKHIDPSSMIMLCAGGRGSLFTANLGLLLGCHIRVGMEDTIWKWPHKDDLIESNAKTFAAMRDIAGSLGRRLMTAEEYRSILSQSVLAAAAE